MHSPYRWLAGLLVVIVGGRVCHNAPAHDELTQQEIQQYRADGSLDERTDRIATLKQFRMSEGAQQRARYKVRRAMLEASGLPPADVARMMIGGPQMAFPFAAQPELRSTGTVRTLTILIDFKDQRAATVLTGLTPEGIRDNIYGTGTPASQSFRPHESLHEYYRRASQDTVNVQGNVLGWHAFPENRGTYAPAKAPATLPPDERRWQQAKNDNRANFRLLSEALDALDANHDFSQYDNDNDGDIDLVTILYAGPPTGWGSFWWAYRWEFHDQLTPNAATKKWDGKRAKQFVFQFVDKRGADGHDFDPTTLLHEMGHAFGLADYYDYYPEIGPPGGVGGLDMMHANQGNHNAFSRWLLDWVKPTVVGAGNPTVHTLHAASSTINTKKAVAIFPGLSGSTSPSEEMFLVENRFKIGNDAQLPGNGLVIWHVDASVNAEESDFSHDNSKTDHKLIRLVRADSANDFGDNEEADAATYFVSGKSFTPTSVPNSQSYDGTDTRISVEEISNAGETMTVRIGFLSSAPAPVPAALAAANASPTSDGETATLESVMANDALLNLDTLEALDRQFATATAATLSEQWKSVDYKKVATSGSESGLAALKLLVAHWAAKDGAHTAEAVLTLPAQDRVRTETLPILLMAWAHQAPAEAAKWYLDDKQSEFRNRTTSISPEFVRQAFQGLYALDPVHAVEGLDKLTSTAEIVNAVDGVLNSATLSGESPDLVSEKLRSSKSEVVKARIEMLKVLSDVEKSISDPKQRKEFRKATGLQHTP